MVPSSSHSLSFDTSDQTWLLLVAEPTEFVCSNSMPIPPVGYPLGYIAPPPTQHEIMSAIRSFVYTLAPLIS